MASCWVPLGLGGWRAKGHLLSPPFRRGPPEGQCPPPAWLLWFRIISVSISLSILKKEKKTFIYKKKNFIVKFMLKMIIW